MIDAQKANYPISWMCSILRVPRSSFSDWRRQAATMTATAARRAELAVQVQGMFDEFRQTYGCRRIARELGACGTAFSVGLVADLMREMGLKAAQPRAYRVTTVHGIDDESPIDLMERDFTCDTPSRKLVGNNNYLRTGQGWLYLATVIDLARWTAADLEAVAHALNTRPRKVLGWKTPTEAFAELLQSLQKTGVASTG